MPIVPTEFYLVSQSDLRWINKPVPEGLQCKYETEQCGSVICNHAVGGNCNPLQRKYLMTFP